MVPLTASTSLSKSLKFPDWSGLVLAQKTSLAGLMAYAVKQARTRHKISRFAWNRLYSTLNARGRTKGTDEFHPVTTHHPKLDAVEAIR